MNVNDIGRVEKVAHGAIRGTIAAMAMTGTRTVTEALGFVPESPPEAMFRRSIRGRHRWSTDRRTQQVEVQIAHWGYGAFGGAIFGALPERLRRSAWAGPLYGVVLWFGFEAVIVPALNVRRHQTLVERVSLLVDHLLYGLVMSEIRRRPQR